MPWYTYVSKHIYVYIYLRWYICIWKHAYVNIYVDVIFHRRIWKTCLYQYAWAVSNMYVCTYLCRYKFLFVLDICMYVCQVLGGSGCLYLYMHEGVYMCSHSYIHLHLFLCSFLCIFLRVCFYVCVRFWFTLPTPMLDYRPIKCKTITNVR